MDRWAWKGLNEAPQAGPARGAHRTGSPAEQPSGIELEIVYGGGPLHMDWRLGFICTGPARLGDACVSGGIGTGRGGGSHFR